MSRTEVEGLLSAGQRWEGHWEQDRGGRVTEEDRGGRVTVRGTGEAREEESLIKGGGQMNFLKNTCPLLSL